VLDHAAARAQMEEMLKQRMPFYKIESWIDRQPISAQRRDALWLEAWIETERAADQRAFRARPQG
jgi:hypothetical protein